MGVVALILYRSVLWVLRLRGWEKSEATQHYLYACKFSESEKCKCIYKKMNWWFELDSASGLRFEVRTRILNLLVNYEKNSSYLPWSPKTKCSRDGQLQWLGAFVQSRKSWVVPSAFKKYKLLLRPLFLSQALAAVSEQSVQSINELLSLLTSLSNFVMPLNSPSRLMRTAWFWLVCRMEPRR